MARFTFSLDGVLRQRKLIEEQKQREFAQINSRYVELESQLREMDAQVQAVTEDLRQNRLVGRIDLDFLAAHRRFTISMQRKALEHAGRMAEVKKAVEAARAALVEAAKQRKVIEKLREKRLDAWKLDQSQREQVATDEVAQQIGQRLAREMQE